MDPQLNSIYIPSSFKILPAFFSLSHSHPPYLSLSPPNSFTPLPNLPHSLSLPTSLSLDLPPSPQPNDFSVSLKAAGKNKHFRVQTVEGVFCIGQRRFSSMDELVEHYKKAPIFTGEQGDRLYLLRPLH